MRLGTTQAMVHQVEVAIMLYRDELEERGMVKAEAEAAIAVRREQLLAGSDRMLSKQTPRNHTRDHDSAMPSRCAHGVPQ